MKTETSKEKAGKAYVRYGVKWSINGKKWFAVINDRSLADAREHLRKNTAPFKSIIKHEIIETEIA